MAGITLTPNENGELEPLGNTKVILKSADDGGIVDEVFTKLDGKYRFPVFSEENYFLIAEKEDYFTTRKTFSTIGKSIDKSELKKMVTDVVFEMDLPLDMIVMDKPIVLNNILYDLDKADIRADAAKELDKLVVTMQDNPEISIELSSHTDIRADHDYNMDLSQRRANSAVAYIISKGIEANRIAAKGYGETRLIVANAKTEEEHQINRRTEFRVTRYDKKFHDEYAEEGILEEVEDLEIDEGVPVEIPARKKDETDRFFTDDEGDK